MKMPPARDELMAAVADPDAEAQDYRNRYALEQNLKMALAILNPRAPNLRLREAAKQYLASINASVEP